ncbi:MAG: ferrous iron transporter B [Oscillospiraceae bacterium]|nr:ferrous iron transporter B [Oscillospiraceae bacterium]
MEIKIALAGNPNCGKTTLFNALTGSNQDVGNWPGVTVEKKEGKLKGDKDVVVTDLPGIYSLSPYTLEEVVARNYLVGERPDVILNIVDGTNLERNLYLTTQLVELGIPVVVAINMMDVVKKNGDKINIEQLSKELGCKVCEISALKGAGVMEAAQLAVDVVKSGERTAPRHSFCGCVEHAIAHIEEAFLHDIPEEQQRWYAIKIFERDEKVLEILNLPEKTKEHIEKDIVAAETEMDDDAESIITNERYIYIANILKGCYKKKNKGGLTTSDKIDKIVTNRILALPIFAVIMFLVYYISVTTVGTWVTDWTNDGLFGDGFHLFNIGAGEFENATAEYAEQNIFVEELSATVQAAADAGVVGAEDILGAVEEKDFGGFDEAYGSYGDALAEAGFDVGAIVDEPMEELPDPAEYGVWVPGVPVLVENALTSINCADWLQSLILDGIIAGVGGVLGFVPQILVLFILLGFLESCGYMARVAFVMDRIFRKFGLSGKSFIPMLVGVGCGVPGIMASRTIENERDRRMTIMTTTFIPCGAKMPIIALIAGALFDNAWWVSPSAFFIGCAAIIVSGIMLKKTKMFAGEPAPFVMELPAYHLPTVGTVLRSMWERGWSFIKRAGTVILLSSIVLWFLQGYGFVDGVFRAVEDNNSSLLAAIGQTVAWIFYPLGWMGDMGWKAAVATVTGLIAKEEVVMTFGTLYNFAGELSESGDEIWSMIAADFGAVTAYSFMIFQLLCAPCFAAIGAIKREMGDRKWTLATVGYMCAFAYVISLIVFQFGGLVTGEATFGVFTGVAAVALCGLLYLIFRKNKYVE